MFDLNKLPNELWFIIFKFCEPYILEKMAFILFLNKNRIKNSRQVDKDLLEDRNDNILILIKTSLLNIYILGNELLQSFYNTWHNIDYYNTKSKSIMKYSEIYSICNKNKYDLQKCIIKSIIMKIYNQNAIMGNNNSVTKKKLRISNLYRYPYRYRGVLSLKEYKEGVNIGIKLYNLMFC